jgi:hypothetical protein
MKNLVLLFSLLVIGLTSCQKEEINPKENIKFKREYYYNVIEINYLQYPGFEPAKAYVNSTLVHSIAFTAYTGDTVTVYTENSNLVIVKSENYYEYGWLMYVWNDGYIEYSQEPQPEDSQFIVIERINTPMNHELVYFEIIP